MFRCVIYRLLQLWSACFKPCELSRVSHVSSSWPAGPSTLVLHVSEMGFQRKMVLEWSSVQVHAVLAKKKLSGCSSKESSTFVLFQDQTPCMTFLCKGHVIELGRKQSSIHPLAVHKAEFRRAFSFFFLERERERELSCSNRLVRCYGDSIGECA